MRAMPGDPMGPGAEIAEEVGEKLRQRGAGAKYHESDSVVRDGRGHLSGMF